MRPLITASLKKTKGFICAASHKTATIGHALAFGNFKNTNANLAVRITSAIGVIYGALSGGYTGYRNGTWEPVNATACSFAYQHAGFKAAPDFLWKQLNLNPDSRTKRVVNDYIVSTVAVAGTLHPATIAGTQIGNPLGALLNDIIVHPRSASRPISCYGSAVAESPALRPQQ
ncbi:MAG: hypothetical protein AB7H77_05430 [Bdellovibrionales bacterium]